MWNIRRAKKEEAKRLFDIAINSEAYWDYDNDYMNLFKKKYKVTEEFINKNSTYLIEDNKIILGFYGLVINDKVALLEYLYIEPDSIGHGYGKLLWNHMIDVCKKKDIKKIELVTSPHAKEFYIKMGARPVGQVESPVIQGRKIPKLIYNLR